MDLSAIGGLLSGGGSFLSGLGIGKKGLSGKDMMKQASVNRQAEQWQMRDRFDFAKANNIHPLVMLGANLNASPVTPIMSGEGIGERMQQMGQGLGRAAQALQSSDERIASNLALENAALQNDLLRAQIGSLNQPQNPPMPNLQRPAITSDAFELGSNPDVSVARSQGGSYAVIPSQDVKSRIEDMFIPELQWYARQVLGDAPKGYMYNPLTSEYFPENENSIQGRFGRFYRYASRGAIWKDPYWSWNRE